MTPLLPEEVALGSQWVALTSFPEPYAALFRVRSIPEAMILGRQWQINSDKPDQDDVRSENGISGA